MNKDLTLDLDLTDDPVVDVSTLNVGLKVGKLQQWYNSVDSAPLWFLISVGI